MNEEMEMQLWDYIDGNCSTEERTRISALIKSNAEWKAAYEELYQFHSDLQGDITHDYTTTNIADAVLNEITPAPAVKKTKSAKLHFYTWGIRLVAAYFLIIIGGVLINTLFTQGFLENTSFNLPEINYHIPVLPHITLTKEAGTIYLIYIAFVMMVTITDLLLRRKKTLQPHLL